jgi:hypothetical protein
VAEEWVVLGSDCLTTTKMRMEKAFGSLQISILCVESDQIAFFTGVVKPVGERHGAAFGGDGLVELAATEVGL